MCLEKRLAILIAEQTDLNQEEASKRALQLARALHLTATEAYLSEDKSMVVAEPGKMFLALTPADIGLSGHMTANILLAFAAGYETGRSWSLELDGNRAVLRAPRVPGPVLTVAQG